MAHEKRFTGCFPSVVVTRETWNKLSRNCMDRTQEKECFVAAVVSVHVKDEWMNELKQRDLTLQLHIDSYPTIVLLIYYTGLLSWFRSHLKSKSFFASLLNMNTVMMMTMTKMDERFSFVAESVTSTWDRDDDKTTRWCRRKSMKNFQGIHFSLLDFGRGIAFMSTTEQYTFPRGLSWVRWLGFQL